MKRSRFRFPGFILLALLVVAHIPAGAGAHELPAAQALTVYTELTVPAGFAAQGEELVLAGIAAGESDVATIRWTRVEGLLFPYWVLRLTGDSEAVPRQGLELLTANPAAGAAYRTALSFDAATGALSLQVVDAATDRTVYAAGLVWEGLADALSGAGSTRAITSGRVTGVRPGYAPLGLTWQPGIRQDGSFQPSLRFERTDEVIVRVETAGPLPAGGELRLASGADGRQLASIQPEESVAELSFPASLLPVGQSELVLTYAAAGETLVQWKQPVTVGSVSARYDRPRRDSAAGILTSTVWLETASDLPELQVTVEAELYAMEWTADGRNYREVPYARLTLFDGPIDVPAGSTGLPLTVPQPPESGLYKVTFSTHLVPDVLQFDAKSSYHFATYNPAAIEPGDPYTIVVLPDTQFYAQNHPHIFLRQTEWIAAQAAERGIGLVLHMGDITNANTWEQWRVASDSMKVLDGIVPYVLAVGNHDNFPEGKANGHTTRRGDSKINAFFSVDDFPHIGGTFEPGRLENAYYTVRLGDTDYLIISLEFGPSDEAVAWADEVAAAHPDHTVILVTHTYTNTYGRRTPVGQIARHYTIGENPETTVNDGEAIWEKFVRKHPHFRFVFSGHIHSPVIPYSASVGDHGNTVYEVLMDFQSEPFGGNGWLVLWEFHPDGSIDVRTYSPYLDEFKTDVQAGFRNEFTLLPAAQALSAAP